MFVVSPPTPDFFQLAPMFFLVSPPPNNFPLARTGARDGSREGAPAGPASLGSSRSEGSLLGFRVAARRGERRGKGPEIQRKRLQPKSREADGRPK